MIMKDGTAMVTCPGCQHAIPYPVRVATQKVSVRSTVMQMRVDVDKRTPDQVHECAGLKEAS